MKLGLHYHINYSGNGRTSIMVPGYFGLFIDEVAKQSDHLYLFLHHKEDQDNENDYEIYLGDKITLVSLGESATFYHRLLMPGRYIRIIKPYADKLDCLIIRGPTPLLPHFSKYLSPHCKIAIMLVGDYVKSLPGLRQPLHRKIPIIILTYWYQWLQNREVKKHLILVNSGEIFEQYQAITKKLHLIKTTTLQEGVIYEKAPELDSSKIKLLYTGRITPKKGLLEVIEALSILEQNGVSNLEFNLVGWEDENRISTIELMKQKSKVLNLKTPIIFHGRKAIDESYFSIYRNADIYIMASHHEGFPRTIWEAMASSLPVIATKVGSIPYYLENNKNAILISPKSPEEIASSVLLLINDKILRNQIITNGLELVREITLEKQTKIIINHIKNEYTGNQFWA